MMNPALICGILGALSGGSDAQPWGQLTVGLHGGLFSNDTIHNTQLDGGLTLTFYPSIRVVDDDAPPSLQPYLQRVSTLSLGVSGGGFATSYNSAFNDVPARQDRFGGASVAANIYLDRRWALTGGAGFSYSVLTDYSYAGFQPTSYTHPNIGLTANAGIGLRLGDLRFDLSYRYGAEWIDGKYADQGWGRLYFSARAVLAQRLDLTLSVNNLPQGAAGSIGLGLYVLRELGLLAGFFYQKGVMFVDTTRVDEVVGGSLGVTYWSSWRTQFAFTYQPSWHGAATLQSHVEHHGYASLSFRFQ